MGYTNETTHYGIPLPLGSDLTTPMDYNTAAEAVDAAVFEAVSNSSGAVDTAAEAVQTANAAATTAAGAVTEAQTAHAVADAATTAAGTAQNTANAAQVTAAGAISRIEALEARHVDVTLSDGTAATFFSSFEQAVGHTPGTAATYVMENFDATVTVGSTGAIICSARQADQSGVIQLVALRNTATPVFTKVIFNPTAQTTSYQTLQTTDATPFGTSFGVYEI